MRQRIAALLSEQAPASLESDRLVFRGATSIEARGHELPVQIDADGRSWALMVDLLQRYDLDAHWDPDQRRVLISAADVAPTYRDDAVQAAVGWPLVEMALNGGHSPVILTGILRPSVQGDRAWCRVLEFAEEFGISVSFEPLVLGERRGG